MLRLLEMEGYRGCTEQMGIVKIAMTVKERMWNSETNRKKNRALVGRGSG